MHAKRSGEPVGAKVFQRVRKAGYICAKPHTARLRVLVGGRERVGRQDSNTANSQTDTRGTAPCIGPWKGS